MQREYTVFKDEAGKYFVIWTDMINICLFGGCVGKLEIAEKGYINKDENLFRNYMEVRKKYN